jgi:hypothetical protein
MSLYDLPMVTAALVLFIQARLETSATFSMSEVIILVLALMFPMFLLLKDVAVPFNAVPLVLLFALIVRRQGDSTGHERLSVA